MTEIINLIHNNENFVITGHASPDGDSIGSCFGLALALDNMGKKVSVMLEPYPSKYNVIPGRRLLHAGKLDKLVADVFIALDCAALDRLGTIAKTVLKRAKHSVCIDHHETNDGFAEFNYIDMRASSTAEMVFRIIEQLTEPDEQIASAIYAGIISDTGGFQYNATAKSTMETAAHLMEIGIPFTKIYNELMHMHRFVAGKVMGVVLDNSAQAMDGRIVYSFMSRDTLASMSADPSDLEGVVEYLVSTRGADVACLVYERHTGERVKVSMRSHGPHVGHVAAALGGGGHQLAAGATVSGTIQPTLEKVLELLEQEILAYDQQQ